MSIHVNRNFIHPYVTVRLRSRLILYPYLVLSSLFIQILFYFLYFQVVSERVEKYQTRITELEAAVGNLERRLDSQNSEGSMRLAAHMERSSQSVKELEERIQERNDFAGDLQAQLQVLKH